MADLWRSEPVRLALWPILALIVAYLGAKGWVSDDDAQFILSLAFLVLGALGIEVARSQVTPVGKDTP